TLDFSNLLLVNIGNAGTDFTAGGGLTLAGTLDSNGDVSIADTNIAFDGASTTFTATGALTLTPGGAMILGSTGQAATLQGTNTTITANGAGNDISITSPDDITINGGSAGSIINIGTNTDGNVLHIADNDTTADTITIGSAKDTSSLAGIGVTVGSTGTSSALTLQSGTG